MASEAAIIVVNGQKGRGGGEGGTGLVLFEVRPQLLDTILGTTL